MSNRLGKCILIFRILWIYFFPIVYVGADIKDCLEDKLYFNRLVDYTDISVGDLHICFPDIYNYEIPRGHKLVFCDNEMDNVVMIHNTLTHIPYSRYQADPRKVFTDGGNCQAVTLLAKAYLDVAKIENELVTETHHMYNRVLIEGEWYILDITNNIFRKD